MSKGPWNLVVGTGHDNERMIQSADGKLIMGEQRYYPWCPDDEEDWNLIAAAPELLGALKFILAFYEPGQTYLDTEAWKRAEASGRRALAKALGKQV